jgi:hypothetical protein
MSCGRPELVEGLSKGPLPEAPEEAFGLAHFFVGVLMRALDSVADMFD